MGDTCIRVFIADDHPIVLAGLRSLLAADPQLEIVGEASDGEVAILRATQLRPDVAVLDMSMPGRNGAEVAHMLRASCPECRVIMITVHDNTALVQGLAGVIAGFVRKDSAPEELLHAIHVVADGGSYLDQATAAKFIGRSRSGTLDAITGVNAELSEREVEVMRLVAAGHSNKEISGKLELSVKTIETYKHRAMEKLGFRTRVEVVHYGLTRGWLIQ